MLICLFAAAFLPFPMRIRFSLVSSLVASFILVGCASAPFAPSSLSVDRTYSSKSQDSRAQFLILHYTSDTFEKSLKILTEGPVSSHYLIDINPPTVYQLVDESKRAFHAGVSRWGNSAALNAASIGIEIVNLGDRKTADGIKWFDYPDKQMDAVIALVKDIVKRHQIRADRILGHSDIAPGRKVDPGPRFPWKRLADEGLIPWPDAAFVAATRPGYERQLPDIAWFQKQLALYGYGAPQTGVMDKGTRDVLEAFQLRFRQSKFDGQPDAETAAILDALTRPEALVK